MSSPANVSEPEARCPGGCPAPQPGDAFCAFCGRPSGRIDWGLSVDGSATAGLVRISPGGRFYLVARNAGFAPVRVELDLAAVTGLSLTGGAVRRVQPGQRQAFELVHLPDASIGGTLRVRTEDGPRPHWWERRGWSEWPVPLERRVMVCLQQWVVGAPVLLFASGVRRQAVRVWNDSEDPRPLPLQNPPGFQLSCMGVPAGPAAVQVGARESVEVLVSVEPGGGDRAGSRSWRPFPEGAEVPIHRLPAARGGSGPDAVVAIDFGTRNTGIRVRWRRTLVPARPAGTVDSIGDRAANARFPSLMVLHRQERSFRWGTEAAEYVRSGRLSEDEVVVDNLKTHLRDGVDRFVEHRPGWTNAELLARYFERLVHRVDEYFRTADERHPITRASLDVRFVVCRPVLDANEGDRAGRAYEAALRTALSRCGVPEAAVTFVQEPVAAAIGIARRRGSELLGLPDGTPVAVVDSGGGTTDVAVARVRLEGGKVDLELLGSYALRLGSGNPALAALEVCAVEDRTEVGGNVLDWALAHKLITRAPEVLESDGQPVPSSLWRGSARDLNVTWLNEFAGVCRRLKERFAVASTQYLNRSPGKAGPAGEVLPFPNREDLRDVRLVHALYDQHLLGPILRPEVEALTGRMAERAAATGGPSPSQVRRVFYVGGTNVDPFVRLHFGRAFPLAPRDADPEAQSESRIAERLNAVVEGAVWFDEQLFSPSPLGLTFRSGGEEQRLLEEGAALPPSGIAAPRFVSGWLEPGEELDAALVASAAGLPGPVQVARAFYRNEGEDAEEYTLVLSVSSDRGAVAELQVGERRLPQWSFALVSSES